MALATTMLTTPSIQNCVLDTVLAKAVPALAALAQSSFQQLGHPQNRANDASDRQQQSRSFATTATHGAHHVSSSGMHHSNMALNTQLAIKSVARGVSIGSACGHSMALTDHGSDDELKQELPAFNAQLFPPQYGYNLHQQHHHAGQTSSACSHSAGKSHHNNLHHHQPYRLPGELHAGHGRRHATSGSGGQPDALSDLLLSCKGLGSLRRVMLKYKANMGPAHVANTLLCLQHAVLEARRLRGASLRRGAAAMSTIQQLAEEDYARLLQQRHGGVRATQEFSRATARAAESDGPQQQLIAQMMGELGNMIWHMMGDMSAADLAKVLYSWARLGWHPEQKLLADVAASFIASANAATGGKGMQQQGYCAGYVLAAGLWGLAKLGEPVAGEALVLLQQHWQALLPHWSQQQLADLAWALAAAADEMMAAEVFQDQQQDMTQLAQLVLGLAERLVKLQEAQQAAESTAAAAAAVGEAGTGSASHNAVGARSSASTSSVKVPWPEVLLKETPAAAAAAATGISRTPPVPPEDAAQVLATAAWRMLQSMAAVGLNVSEPVDPRVGEVVAALSVAMQQQPRGRW